MSSTFLVADARERAVITFLETNILRHQWVVKQVTTADYLICRGDKVLAAFERKTYQDYAASFADGRHENVQKLRSLRDRTGCQLYYILEGPAFPSPNRRFGRVPASAIVSSVTHLMVRDGIQLIQTENEQHTASRLNDMLKAFDAVTPRLSDIVEGGGEAAGAVAAVAAATTTDEDGDPVVPGILTEKTELSEDTIAVNMWSQLRGISVVLGSIVAGEFSVCDLACGKVAPAVIRELKTATGRKINADAATSLAAVAAGDPEVAVRIVSGMPGISSKLAQSIMSHVGSLAQLCQSPVELIAAINVQGSPTAAPRRLGEKRAARIWRLLRYARGRPETKPGDSGHKLGTTAATATAATATTAATAAATAATATTRTARAEAAARAATARLEASAAAAAAATATIPMLTDEEVNMIFEF